MARHGGTPPGQLCGGNAIENEAKPLSDDKRRELRPTLADARASTACVLSPDKGPESNEKLANYAARFVLAGKKSGQKASRASSSRSHNLPHQSGTSR
jgi:hypothetical protein